MAFLIIVFTLIIAAIGTVSIRSISVISQGFTMLNNSHIVPMKYLESAKSDLEYINSQMQSFNHGIDNISNYSSIEKEVQTHKTSLAADIKNYIAAEKNTNLQNAYNEYLKAPKIQKEIQESSLQANKKLCLKK